LFIGIHNSWDAAAYVATQRPEKPQAPPGQRAK